MSLAYRLYILSEVRCHVQMPGETNIEEFCKNYFKLSQISRNIEFVTDFYQKKRAIFSILLWYGGAQYLRALELTLVLT